MNNRASSRVQQANCVLCGVELGDTDQWFYCQPCGPKADKIRMRAHYQVKRAQMRGEIKYLDGTTHKEMGLKTLILGTVVITAVGMAVLYAS